MLIRHGRRSVPLFLLLLRDDDLVVGAVAAGASFSLQHIQLGREKERVVEALTEALRDPSSMVKVKAAGCLIALGSRRDEAFTVLKGLLDDADPEVRSLAKNFTKWFGKGVIQDLEEWMRAVEGEDVELRRSAARSARTMFDDHGRKVVPLFLRLLSDEDLEVRRMASDSAWSLENMRLGALKERAVTAIAEALRDPDAKVRIQSAGCLLSLGSEKEKAHAALKDLLEDADPKVRADALWKLGDDEEPDAAVLEIVTKSLDAEDNRMRDSAAHALGMWGRKSVNAIPILLRGLQDPDPDIQSAFAGALEHVDWKKPPMQTIAALAAHQNPAVRHLAVFMLQAQHKRSYEALRILTTALADEHARIRSTAAFGLGNRGWRSLRAVPKLWKAFQAHPRSFEKWWILLCMERAIMPYFPPLTMLTILGLIPVGLFYGILPKWLKRNIQDALRPRAPDPLPPQRPPL